MNCDHLMPGIVENNADPTTEGKLQIRVPQIFGLASSTEKIATADLPWARPCFPFTGKTSGMAMVPEIGAGVWVMFAGGDPRLPVWLGCYYGTQDKVPEFVAGHGPAPKTFVLKTPTGHKLVLDETVNNSVLLKSSGLLNLISEAKMNITSGAAFLITALTTLAVVVVSTFTLTVGAALTVTAVGLIQILGVQIVIGQAATAREVCTRELIDLFNTHTHNYTLPAHAAGSGPTNPPLIPGVHGVHTTINTKVS